MAKKHGRKRRSRVSRRVKKTCPKCGNGVFMASHKDRDYCGRCHYMEKKSVEKKEEKREGKKEDKPKK